MQSVSSRCACVVVALQREHFFAEYLLLFASIHASPFSDLIILKGNIHFKFPTVDFVRRVKR